MGAAAAARRPDVAKDPDYPEILRAVEAKVKRDGQEGQLHLEKITLGIIQFLKDEIHVVLFGTSLQLQTSELGTLELTDTATISYGDQGLKFGFRNRADKGNMQLGADVINVDGREVQINNLQNFVREVVQALLVEFAVAGLELEGHPKQELEALVERATRPDEGASYDRHRSGLWMA